MSYPEEWNAFEKKFDKNNEIKPRKYNQPSLTRFCLRDFYIIQKWVDYAKGIDDPTASVFNDRPVIFQKIYETANLRRRS